MAVRGTWAQARDEAALAANVYGQAVYAMEFFLSESSDIRSRFLMLWSAMQPWKEVLYFSFFSSHLERAARLLFRLLTAATFAALLRQAIFGAFARSATDKVCQERQDDTFQVLAVSLLCYALARLCAVPLSSPPLGINQRCVSLRWAVLMTGNLSAVLVIILFLANSSDADGMWWLLCLCSILFQEFLLNPFVVAFVLASISTILLLRRPDLAEELRDGSVTSPAPPLQKELSKEKLQQRISISSEPSVVMEDQGRFQPPSLFRNISEDRSKGQILSVLPGNPS